MHSPGDFKVQNKTILAMLHGRPSVPTAKFMFY
jgi:hypothetical protein